MNRTLDPRSLDQRAGEIADWEANEVASFLKKQAERKPAFFTTGDIPVKRAYTAADIADTPIEDIGLPGRYPFTRGPYPTMYRSRFWTMRQIAGFGTGEDPNKRFKFLIAAVQADILKEYMAQKEYCYPIGPSVRIVRDCITYCAEHMKRYNPINISGYHISEAGASPLQEAAFTLANGIVYVEEVLKAGMDVDKFAPRLAFYFVSQGDFFEEIAKFRAARRCWAKIMKQRFGAKNPESMRLRFHCQTAAATLTRPQYQINIVRTAMQALSAVLGGCQSLHTNGYDEAFAIPTEDAMRVALRTQQIIAEETNVANVVDPIGGSYYVEALTDEYERRIFQILGYVDANGGTIKLIEDGWFQKQIADFPYETALR